MTENNPLTRDFGQRLTKLRGFAGLVEETLIARTAALDAELSARAETFPEDERQEFFEFHADNYFELADELPTILRYSVLTGADTALEAYLNNTCETYAELHGASVRLGDLKGTGIQRARQYLKKVAQVAFPDQTPTWTTVIRLHELRNCIIHADGIVETSQKDLRLLSDSITSLHITAHGTISLAREFTEIALDSYEKFAIEFDAACGELDLWRSVFPFEDA
jgi:hypothetical protein